MHPDTPPTPPTAMSATTPATPAAPAAPRRDLVGELFAAALDGDRLARADLTDLARSAGRGTPAARALAALPAVEPAPAAAGSGPAPWAVAYVDQLFARVADPHRR